MSYQETKPGYTNKIPRQSNSLRCGSSQMKTHPLNSKDTEVLPNKMIACFLAKFRDVAAIPLDDRKTVTADWYANHCLPKVFQAWCKWRPQTCVHGLLLHHDNASEHTAAVTPDCLAAIDVQMVTHPPYSPYLAPCGCFFIFCQKAAEGKAVSDRQRCPSILRERHFGHTPVNAVGCHRQLV